MTQFKSNYYILKGSCQWALNNFLWSSKKIHWCDVFPLLTFAKNEEDIWVKLEIAMLSIH